MEWLSDESGDDAHSGSLCRSRSGSPPLKRARLASTRKQRKHLVDYGTCFGCKDEFRHSDLVGYKGILLCKPDFNAVRARNRSLDNAEVLDMDDKLKSDPSAWVDANASLFDKTMSMSQRKQVITDMKVRQRQMVLENKSSDKQIDDDLVLNRIRYCSYRMQWDRISEEEANQDFTDEHRHQRGKHDKGGVERVAVEDNPRLRKSRGMSQREALLEGDHVTEGEAARTRQRMENFLRFDTRARPRSRSRSRRRSRGAFSSHGDVPRPSMARALSSETIASSHAHSDQLSTPRRPTRSVSPTPGRRRPTRSVSSTPGRLALVDPAPGGKKEYEEEQREEDVEASGQIEAPQGDEWTAVEILGLKKGWKNRLNEMINALVNGKGQAGSLKSKVMLLQKQCGGDARLSECSPDEKVELIDNLSAKAATLKADGECCRVADVEGMLQRHNEITLEYKSVQSEIAKHIEALQFIVSSKVSESRSARLKVRHAKDRVGRQFTAAGCRTRFLKEMQGFLYEVMDKMGHVEADSSEAFLGGRGNNVEDIPQKVSEIISDTPMLKFTCNERVIDTGAVAFIDDAGHELKKFVTKYQEISEQTCESKIVGSTAKLEENCNWPLLDARIRADLRNDHGLPQLECLNKMAYIAEDGGEAWLWTVKRGMFKEGALNGVACIMGCLTGDAFVLACPIDPMLSKGVAMADVPTFYEQTSGIDFLKTRAKLVYMVKGAVVFIPMGWMVHVMYHQKQGEPELQHGYHIPVIEEELAKAVPKGVLRAVSSHNISYAKNQIVGCLAKSPGIFENVFQENWSSSGGVIVQQMLASILGFD